MGNRIRKVQDYPNLVLDLDSGIYYVRRMVNNRPLMRTTGQRTLQGAIPRYLEIQAERDQQKSPVSPEAAGAALMFGEIQRLREDIEDIRREYLAGPGRKRQRGVSG